MKMHVDILPWLNAYKDVSLHQLPTYLMSASNAISHTDDTHVEIVRLQELSWWFKAARHKKEAIYFSLKKNISCCRRNRSSFVCVVSF